MNSYLNSVTHSRKRRGKSASKRPSPTRNKHGVEKEKRSARYRYAQPSHMARPTWKPPRGTWEPESFQIDGCQGDSIEDLMICITWPGGHKTRQKLDLLCKKCPQKVRKSW